MTKDDFMLPDGTPDIDRLRRALMDAAITPEQMQAKAERARYIKAKKYAARHRISMSQAYGRVR